jgi:nuclease-like protein
MAAARLVRLQPPWEAGRRRRRAERRTARALRQVERAGYLVLRDLVVPGTPVHIGHLVVGATGVWALESRRWSWARALQVRRRRRGALDRLRQSPAGRYDPSWHPAWLLAAAASARSTAHAVAEATMPPRPRIRPLLCVHGRMPRPGLLVDGVPVVTARQLVDALSRGPLLGEDELAAVADGVMAVVRPAA